MQTTQLNWITNYIWGNGNVEVPFESVEHLPYVMGLIRQGFEKPMGNGEADA